MQQSVPKTWCLMNKATTSRPYILIVSPFLRDLNKRRRTKLLKEHWRKEFTCKYAPKKSVTKSQGFWTRSSQALLLYLASSSFFLRFKWCKRPLLLYINFLNSWGKILVGFDCNQPRGMEVRWIRFPLDSVPSNFLQIHEQLHRNKWVLSYRD